MPSLKIHIHRTETKRTKKNQEYFIDHPNSIRDAFETHVISKEVIYTVGS